MSEKKAERYPTTIDVVIPVLGLCILLGFLLFPDDGGPLLLLAGWIYFCRDVLPSLAVNWRVVGVGVVSLVVLGVGLHLFCRWAYSASAKRLEKPNPRQWQRRWSLGVLMILLFTFVAGITMVGITHQTAWLLTSPEPLYVGGSRAATARGFSRNNLNSIGLGVHSVADRNAGRIPQTTFDPLGHPLHGWQTALLPYLEQKDLHGKIDHSKPWNHPVNAQYFQQEMREYLQYRQFPQKDSSGYALSHYASNVWLIGGHQEWRIKSIPDGLSNTLMAGEAMGNFKPWGHPANWRDPTLGINKTLNGFGTQRHGYGAGTSFLMTDGSVRFISENVDPKILKAVATPNGGEPISEEW